ncbi:MAG: hypothetical protein U0798_00700 [Gemmataceae bacterium]
MNCDTASERLLSLPASSRPDAELAAHLASCPACKTLLAHAGRVDQLVATLPYADSTPRKAAFLASLTTGKAYRRPESRPFSRFIHHPSFRPLMTLAAAVLIAFTAFTFWPRKTGPGIDRTAVAKHELLEKSIDFALDQSRKPLAADRMESATNYAGQLLANVRGIYLATPKDDVDTLQAISVIYVSMLEKGVTETANDAGLRNPIERKTTFDPFMPTLAGYAQATRDLATTAPVHVKPILSQMENATVACAKSLEKLGASPASPKPFTLSAGSDAGLELRNTKLNKAVIELLAIHGLKAGAATDPIERANEVREASAALATALDRAISDGDADRAGDLGTSLATMLTDGVKPAFDRANQLGGNTPNSPYSVRVGELKAKIKADAERASSALRIKGPMSDHPQIINARKRLDEAASQLL